MCTPKWSRPHHIYPDEFYEITNIHRSEYQISSKSYRHNPWAHYPKRNPGENSRIIPHTAGCQHRIPERGIRHCWWHFRQRNLRIGFTLHAVTTLRADLLSRSENDRPERTSLLKDMSAGKQKEDTYVLPPRPFRNGLKCMWQA